MKIIIEMFCYECHELFKSPELPLDYPINYFKKIHCTNCGDEYSLNIEVIKEKEE